MAGNNIWRVSANDTSFHQPADTKYDGYSVDSAQTKTANTANDTAVTWYVVDLDNRIIHSFVYGAGVDRTIPYGEAAVYSVSYDYAGVTFSNTAESVVEGDAYSTTLTANKDYAISSVVVKMGGTDITSTAYANGTITIAQVTGNIEIKVTTVENYVPHWDVGDRTAVKIYKSPTDAKTLSRHNYYWGAAGNGAVYHSYITSCTINDNNITFNTDKEKNIGIGVPFQLEPGASYTFSAKSSVKGRIRYVVFNANGTVSNPVVSAYGNSGTSHSLTFTAPADATQWVMLIVDQYTAGTEVTYSNISLTKN
jgi:hypothetical protein